jgi:hypothetical protein
LWEQGANNQPTGLLNDTGINSHTRASNGINSLADMAAMEKAIAMTTMAKITLKTISGLLTRPPGKPCGTRLQRPLAQPLVARSGNRNQPTISAEAE